MTIERRPPCVGDRFCDHWYGEHEHEFMGAVYRLWHGNREHSREFTTAGSMSEELCNKGHIREIETWMVEVMKRAGCT